jgi:hypothetical protein
MYQAIVVVTIEPNRKTENHGRERENQSKQDNDDWCQPAHLQPHLAQVTLRGNSFMAFRGVPDNHYKNSPAGPRSFLAGSIVTRSSEIN